MIKTINLSANVEQDVEVTGGVHARFENIGDGTVYVSKSANVTAGGDGVIAISSGATKYVKNVANYGEYDGEYGYQGTVYVKADSTCKVEIETGDYFFKSGNSGKGGAISGKFLKVIDRVDSKDDLPITANEGDVYLVGLETDEDCDEYVYTSQKGWERIGNTDIDLSDFVKTSDMADVYGIEETTVPTIESKVEENSVTLGYSGKNLFNVETGTSGMRGVTITVNADKSIKLSGTVTSPDNAYFSLNSNSFLPRIEDNKYYILSGIPSNVPDAGNQDKIILYPSGTDNEDQGKGIILTKNMMGTEGIMRLRVKSGTNVDGIIIKPMLRSASITDDTYEPYKPSVDERLNEVDERLEIINSNCEKVRCGTTSNQVYYTIFCKMSKTNSQFHCSATFILSDLANMSEYQTGVWIVQCSNRSNAAHMAVKNLLPPTTTTGFVYKFGYYSDNNYFYFGVMRPPYSGSTDVNVLSKTTAGNVELNIGKIFETSTKPKEWVDVSEI